MKISTHHCYLIAFKKKKISAIKSKKPRLDENDNVRKSNTSSPYTSVADQNPPTNGLSRNANSTNRGSRKFNVS